MVTNTSKSHQVWQSFRANVENTIDRAFDTMQMEVGDPVLTGLRKDVAQGLLFDRYHLEEMKGGNRITFPELSELDPDLSSRVQRDVAMAEAYGATSGRQYLESVSKGDRSDELLNRRNEIVGELVDRHLKYRKPYSREDFSRLGVDDIDQELGSLWAVRVNEAFASLKKLVESLVPSDTPEATEILSGKIDARKAFSKLVVPIDPGVIAHGMGLGHVYQVLDFEIPMGNYTMKFYLPMRINEFVRGEEKFNCYLAWERPDRSHEYCLLIDIFNKDKKPKLVAEVDLDTITPEIREAIERLAISLCGYQI